MSPIAKAMLEIAASQVGVREVGGNNKGPEIVKYQKTTSLAPGAWPWCAAFVSYCLHGALQQNDVVKYLQTVSKTVKNAESWRCNSARAFNWIDWATKRTGNGAQVLPNVRSAQAGDILVFDFNGAAAGGGHIGIIESVSGEVINTIEGNTGAAGLRDSDSGDGVVRKVRKFKLVRAIIRVG